MKKFGRRQASTVKKKTLKQTKYYGFIYDKHGRSVDKKAYKNHTHKYMADETLDQLGGIAESTCEREDHILK